MNKTALHKAIDLLSRREHSIKELKEKLLLRDIPIDDLDVVITYLVENDYLSELRYAESVYRGRVSKGYGKRYIESELHQKGIGRQVITEVAEELSIDWYQQAEQAYRKKFGWKSIDGPKERAKRIRFLQYRGFSTDEIVTVLEENSCSY